MPYYYFFPTYTTITGKQCSVFMPKHQITQHLYRTKCSFFPNCKQILCITTFELLCMSSQSSLFNTVVGSVRFLLLETQKIYSIFETDNIVYIITN